MALELKERTSRPPETDGRLLPNLYRVESRRRETADTFTLTMIPASSGPELTFEPGQFNMLTAFGIGEVPISISGDPTETQRLVHTIRAVGATTRTLCGLARGELLGVRGPFGTA
jgi:NAD(P)H-flavin reductase